MKKVLTAGVYDLLHIGHVELFRRAKEQGDSLIVAVQDSEYILKYKPQANTVETTDQRCYMVRAIRYVDDVVVYTDIDKLMTEVDFDVFVKGPDQKHDGFKRAVEWCEANGKEVVTLARTEGISTTDIKKRIAGK